MRGVVWGRTVRGGAELSELWGLGGWLRLEEGAAVAEGEELLCCVVR